MKKLYFTLFQYLLFHMCFAQDTIVTIAYTSPQPFSNFEDRDSANYFHINSTAGNIWQIGTPSKTVFNSAYSLPLALVTDTLNPYPVGNHSSFEFVVLSDDFTIISFRHRYDTDSLTDGGVVEVSYDNGLTWTNIIQLPQFSLNNFYGTGNSVSSNGGQPGFSGSSSWIFSTMEIYGGLNYARFRFTFTSDSIDTGKDGWMIDNFNFICWGTGIRELNAFSVRVYPNPSSGMTTVHTDNTVHIQVIHLRNMLGQVLYSGISHDVDLSPLPPGLYFLEVVSDKATYTQRVQRD